jgi:NTP pyrophosphatase (non-canonical NTP hydrolase)
MSDLSDLQKQAIEIARRYDELNKRQGNAAWSTKDRMMGFVTDIGELNELVMAKEGLRNVEDVDAKIEHELGDCLWSLLVLASHYSINLEEAFTQTMVELEKRTAA